MEEDIAILEEWVEVDRRTRNYSKESDFDKFCEEKNVAIENLIKGYRELQKENELYKLTFGEPPLYESEIIPKSKIREKIEELEKRILEYEAYRETGKETDVEYYDFISNSARKKVLQKLLEGEV